MTATDERLNWDTERDDDETPESEPRIPSYEVIFGAPDYSSVVKLKKTAKARDYETRVLSVEKALLNGCLRRGNLPDAAIILQRGAELAEALGAAADESEYVARGIDIITAPDSPWVPLVLTLVGVTGQFYRNHQQDFDQAAVNVKTTWKQRRADRKQRIIDRKAGVLRDDAGPVTEIKLPFGRKIKLRWKISIPGIAGFFAAAAKTAVPPGLLVHNVFSDDALRAALKKQGYDFRVSDDGTM